MRIAPEILDRIERDPRTHELRVICVCGHHRQRHRSDGARCRRCMYRPWSCSRFVSLADARKADRQVGPAWEPPRPERPPGRDDKERSA